MDIFETIKSRYSVRKYQNKPVSDDDLNKILASARLAPSAHNSQNCKVVVVKDRLTKDKLAQITRMSFVAQAPVVLVGIAPDPSSEYWPIDMAIVFDHIALAAVGLGLGTCWVGSVADEAKIREAVKSPQDTVARIVMPLGYPDHKAMPKVRKDAEQIFSEEVYK